MSDYTITTTRKFESDLKVAKKRGLVIKKLETILNALASNKKLDEKYKDHLLSNNFKGMRECHIEPDWLLIYKKDKSVKVLALIRTGTHSDLF